MVVTIDQIRQLPIQEQRSLTEQIWDGLLASGHLIRQWQIDEVRRRSKELAENPQIALTEDEVWRRVDELRNG